MIHAQMTKKTSLVVPASVASGATASAQVDTIGFDYAEFTVHSDSVAAASNIPTTYTISDGDTSTAYTAIAALTGDGASGFTIPTALSATVGNLLCVGVNLLPRRRWLRLQYTPGVAATVIAAEVALSRAKDAPSTAAERNVALAVVDGP